jgi:hypothetical protein
MKANALYGVSVPAAVVAALLRGELNLINVPWSTSHTGQLALHTRRGVVALATLVGCESTAELRHRPADWQVPDSALTYGELQRQPIGQGHCLIVDQVRPTPIDVPMRGKGGLWVIDRESFFRRMEGHMGADA